MSASRRGVDWQPIPNKKPDSRWAVQMSQTLGVGGFASVFRGKDKGESGNQARECAAKKIPLKSAWTRESFESERDALKAIEGHKYVIRIYGAEEEVVAPNDVSGWIFLEMATGGELFDRLIDSGSLTECAAWPYVSAIAEAVGHCFSVGVIHRDLKLENVMLQADDPTAIRLIDFGLALQLEVGKDGRVIDALQTEQVGTQAYRPPEINLEDDTRPVPYSPLKLDVWSLGIITFSLVAGFFPVQEAKEIDWRFKRLRKEQNEGTGACKSIFGAYKRKCFFSPDLCSLIDGMLTIDCDKRFCVDDVLQHPWITMRPAAEPQGPVYRGASDLDNDVIMDDPFADLAEDMLRPKRQNAQRIVAI